MFPGLAPSRSSLANHRWNDSSPAMLGASAAKATPWPHPSSVNRNSRANSSGARPHGYPSARLIRAEGYPWGRAPEEFARLLRFTEEGWGHGVALPVLAPSMAGDDSFQRWFAKLERLGASPGNMLALLQLHRDVDIRHVLPAIRVPTLVLHRSGDTYREVGHGRYLAAHIPGAKYAELPGRDHLPYVGDQAAVLDEVEEFLTGVRRGPEPDRVLVTVLFTDIVGSTERAVQAGDYRWRDLLDRHNVLVRRELDHFRGREVDTAGTVSWRPSTGRPGRSGAPAGSPTRSRAWGWNCAAAYTPARSSSPETASAESP